MKTYGYLQYAFALVILATAAFTFSACDKNDGPSGSEKRMKLLVGTWTVNSVKVDGVDRTDLFDGMTLTFSDAPPFYKPANGGRIWRDQSTFSFLDGDGIQFMGPGNQVVTIKTLTENAFVFEMEWTDTTIGFGRTKSIAGHHEFVLSK